MEFKTWLLESVKQIKNIDTSSNIRFSKIQSFEFVPNPTKTGGANFRAFIHSLPDISPSSFLFTASAYNEEGRDNYYYGLWETGIGYLYQIDGQLQAPVANFIYGMTTRASTHKVYGSTPLTALKHKFPFLFNETCNECNCCNDKLVTGWCTNKIPGVRVWN